MAESVPAELFVRARAVAPSLAELGLSARRAVVAVAGTTAALEPLLVEQLLPALKSVVSVVADHGAVVVTGGTDAGIFHVLGLAVESSRRDVYEIGVAPDRLVLPAGRAPAAGSSKAPIDPCLDVLVRVEGSEWGDETLMLSRVVTEVAGENPAVVLLIGGGDITRDELVEHLRRGRTIVVLSGTGRLADQVAAGLGADADPDLRALLNAGDVHIVAVDGEPETIARVLKRTLRTRRSGPPALVRWWGARRTRWAALSVFPRFRYRGGGEVWPLIDGDAAQRFPLLADRIAEADELIFPSFAESDREALVEQNRYRWFAVLALFGGLLTTAFGAVQAWLQTASWPGIVVATLGAGTAALSTLSRRQGSLHQYLMARLRAERLRSLYFEHIAKPPPADPADEADRRDLEVLVAKHRYGKLPM